MHAATVLLSFLSINFALSFPAPERGSIDSEHHSNTKRAKPGWCTLHYVQFTINLGRGGGAGNSRLTVYDPSPSGQSRVPIPGAFNYYNGAYNILPDYGDFLVALNDDDDNVTFKRHGTISADTWTVLKNDSGSGLAGHDCSVGGWYYGISRSMDCGFECTPYTGPYAQST